MLMGLAESKIWHVNVGGWQAAGAGEGARSRPGNRVVQSSDDTTADDGHAVGFITVGQAVRL